MSTRAYRIPLLTCVFLVLLRLAIGWHFLVEGYQKVASVYTGPTESAVGSSRPFSSVGYLRESAGPLSSFFHWQAGGDPDEMALERFAVRPLPEGKDPAQASYRERIPPALDEDWNEYLERFAQHYQLTDDQRKDAQGRLDQSKELAVNWLLGLKGEKEIENTTFPTATFKEKETPPQRINEYRARLDEIRRLLNKELPAFGKDTSGQRLRTLKADAARLRGELLADLERPMLDNLQSVLTDKQKGLGPVPPAESVSPGDWVPQRALAVIGRAEATPVPPRIAWVDWGVRWALVVIGACLFAGLFSRPAAIAGALFLAMLYLAMPPFPWLPENLRAEGHYLFVNKNLIEMVALLALATVPTGRWFGLDGLVQFFNPRRWRAAPAEPARTGVPDRRLAHPSLRA
jgi:uncharacterized membrane protein YphA (DoxX/SURF4 family)